MHDDRVFSAFFKDGWSESPGADFQGVISRRAGNIRAVTLAGRPVNEDRIFGAARAAQESIDKIFHKTPHDIQLEADRGNYELKDNVLIALRRINAISR